jgi:hypothetical protein
MNPYTGLGYGKKRYGFMAGLVDPQQNSVDSGIFPYYSSQDIMDVFYQNCPWPLNTAYMENIGVSAENAKIIRSTYEYFIKKYANNLKVILLHERAYTITPMYVTAQGLKYLPSSPSRNWPVKTFGGSYIIADIYNNKDFIQYELNWAGTWEKSLTYNQAVLSGAKDWVLFTEFRATVEPYITAKADEYSAKVAEEFNNTWVNKAGRIMTAIVTAGLASVALSAIYDLLPKSTTPIPSTTPTTTNPSDSNIRVTVTEGSEEAIKASVPKIDLQPVIDAGINTLKTIAVDKGIEALKNMLSTPAISTQPGSTTPTSTAPTTTPTTPTTTTSSSDKNIAVTQLWPLLGPFLLGLALIL